MLYRFKQFLAGLLGRLSPADHRFVAGYLQAWELVLFYRLSRGDQVHSVCVARRVAAVLAARQEEDLLLMKAAFLHDVGKIGSGLNIINRSLFVLADRFLPSWRRRFSRCRPVQAYRSHGELAMPFLPQADEELKTLIRLHHQHEATDPRLQLLQEMDGQC